MNKAYRTNIIGQRLPFTLIIAIITFLMVMSCDNNFTTSDPDHLEGKGSFTLLLSDPEAIEARTILPDSLDLSDFALYCLTFTPVSNGTALHADRTNASLSTDPIFLDPGVYDLVVNAYKDEDKNQLMARGTLNAISITAGSNTFGKVFFKPIPPPGGTGTFRWDINLPEVFNATMEIIPSSEDGTAQQTVTLSIPNATGSRILKSGKYTISIKLEKMDGEKLVWHELLYVYQNLESVLDMTFTYDHFVNPVYIVTFDSNFSSSSWTMPNNVRYPATVEVYALGGGGGGQGGHWSDDLIDPSVSTGAAGGGGAAAYAKFDVNSPQNFQITVGRGGQGGDSFNSPKGGPSWSFGHRGSDGGDTTVSWSNNNTITAQGGKGGGPSEDGPSQGTNTNLGGTGGTAIGSYTDYGQGGDGEGGSGRIRISAPPTRSEGGRAGILTTGSINPFGGARGGYNSPTLLPFYPNILYRPGGRAGSGAGGAGGHGYVNNRSVFGFTDRVTGGDGGNGQVSIVITWDE